MIETSFLLLAADPNVLPQMDKGIQLILGAIVFVIVVIGRDSLKSVLSVMGEGMMNGLRKSLMDKSVVAEQKRITEDIKNAVELMQSVQTAQINIQNELRAVGEKNISILRDVDKISRQTETNMEVVSSLRERVANLEGRLE